MGHSQVEWIEAAKVEADARHRVFEAGDDASVDDCRKWWAAVEKLFWMLSNARADGESVALPLEFLIAMQGITGLLATGNLPSQIRKVRGVGKPPTDAYRARLISWAVLYVRHGREGMLPEKNWTQTAARAFGVTEQRVEQWAAEINVPESVGNNLHSIDELRAEMLRAGEEYARDRRGT